MTDRKHRFSKHFANKNEIVNHLEKTTIYEVNPEDIEVKVSEYMRRVTAHPRPFYTMVNRNGKTRVFDTMETMKASEPDAPTHFKTTDGQTVTRGSGQMSMFGNRTVYFKDMRDRTYKVEVPFKGHVSDPGFQRFLSTYLYVTPQVRSKYFENNPSINNLRKMYLGGGAYKQFMEDPQAKTGAEYLDFISRYMRLDPKERGKYVDPKDKLLTNAFRTPFLRRSLEQAVNADPNFHAKRVVNMRGKIPGADRVFANYFQRKKSLRLV